MTEKNYTLKNSILLACSFAILIAVIKACEVLLGHPLHHLGLFPQTASGLIGIITGPLIHGSWQHLASNIPALILLGSILIYGYPKSRWWTLTTIWLLSGIGVWVFGRSSFHFGASGLTHGMFFFLFIGGIVRRDKRSIALLMVAFFMYGSMLMTIFPSEPGISYEYHFFGAAAGSICALIFRHWDPKPQIKTYAWQHSANDNDVIEEEDPIIGDQWKLNNQVEEPDSPPHQKTD